MMSVHGYVPDDFGVGVVVPVLKDRSGDLCSADNYRSITLSSVIFKVFEYCVLQKYNDMLNSNNLQFRFKQHFFACAHALFVLSQVVYYFISYGSSVYLASLDASNPFDRVNHVELFDKLADRELAGNIINVLIDWYGKISVSVK